MTPVYPPPPAGVTPEILLPSATFRTEVRNVTAALIGFAILYLVLVAAAVVLAAGLGLVAYMILTHIHNWFAIAVGIGLLGVGVMVVFFVFKFLFANKKAEAAAQVEINEAEQPELFAFIRRISQETCTQFPKHIYLSPEVNAMVFYNSNFWSMLLPVRKNLVIGLGLVNMTNLSEFKAVIAHEFGHFSQKSMRAGSFVYQANKVIFNLLYENDSYSGVLNRWGRIHWTFGMCAQLTAGIVNTIQWILREAYKSVNTRYLSLSRQMEFHADTVAAAVAGSNNTASALRRIEFADTCYQSVISYYNSWVADSKKGVNIYLDQRSAGRLIGTRYKYHFTGGLPVIESGAGDASRSRIKISDQWASHPSLEQREASLSALGLTGSIVDESPWMLFRDTDALQEQLTAMLYERVEFKDNPQPAGPAAFEHAFNGDTEKFRLPEVFAEFYNDRLIAEFNPDRTLRPGSAIGSLPDYFTREVRLPRQLAALEADIAQLEMIEANKDSIRVFELDGIKRKAREAATLQQQLRGELEGFRQELAAADENVYRNVIQQLDASSSGAGSLEQQYRSMFTAYEVVTARLELCNLIMEKLSGFQSQIELDAARALDRELRSRCRDLLESMRAANKALQELPGRSNHFAPFDSTAFEQGDWQFISLQNELLVDNLNALVREVQAFGNWNVEVRFHAQQAALELQAGLLATVPRSALSSDRNAEALAGA